MRIAALLLICLFSMTARAQMVFVLLKDEKIEKLYSKYLTRLGASSCIVGELKGGIKIDGNTFRIIQGAQPLNEFWVADSMDPATLPYATNAKTGTVDRNKKAKLGFVGVPGDHILAVRFLDRFRTLAGTANEYQQALDEVSALIKERDSKKKTERAWFDLHGKLTARLDRLVLWLNSLGFGARAKEVQKEVDKQKKSVAKSAAAEREKMALASIKTVPTPEKLTQLAAKHSNGKAQFKVQESMHLRFTYSNELADADVTAVLELGEQVIEGFLREVVDPFVDDDFPNQIPEGLLHEFYYGPANLDVHEKMLPEYYGLAWGINKSDELKSEGAEYYRKEAPFYLSYRKITPETDLPGYTVHLIGHSLMDMHYNMGSRNDAMDWLREAVGYYVSLNYIGRNGCVCYSTDETSYEKTRQEIGIKTAQNGIADVMNQVAVKIGPSIEALAGKRLHAISDPDFAKAWSFYDFALRKLGKPGQVWLRDTCKLAGEGKASFYKDWRARTEKLRPVEPGIDVFGEIDKEWKKYAEKEQIAGPTSRK